MFENSVFHAKKALGGLLILFSQIHGSIYKKGNDGDGSTIAQEFETAS